MNDLKKERRIVAITLLWLLILLAILAEVFHNGPGIAVTTVIGTVLSFLPWEKL